MSKAQLNDVRHDYIRYANCWEDADILLEGLQIKPGDSVLSIGSAGDNSFSLLTGNPDLVVAVDINLVQLYLIELKKAAFLTFDHSTFLEFLGFDKCTDRWNLYLKLQNKLPEEQNQFWIRNRKSIEVGIITQGKFEKYFEKFRKKILPFIHSKNKVSRLLVSKDANAQQKYFDKTWNTWRWKYLFKFFFSRFLMGRLGRDPKFLKEVDFSVSSFILAQAKQHLSSPNCQDNYFLRYIFTGKFGENLPHYARKENFEIIKNNLDKLQLFHGFAEEAFKEHGQFNKFNLSNIFEYMDSKTFEAVSQNLIDNGTSDARYAYWNLMVTRHLSTTSPALNSDPETSEKLTKKDFGFFYKAFLIDIKHES